jgi:hypothetical protein
MRVLDEVYAKIAEITSLMKRLEAFKQEGINGPSVERGIYDAARLLKELQNKRDLLEEASRRLGALVITR